MKNRSKFIQKSIKQIHQESFKNRARNDQHSIKNPSQIDPKSIKNRPKIDENLILEPFRFQEPKSECPTRSHRGIRAVFWAPLVAHGPQVGSQHGAKIDIKSIPKSIKKSMPLEIPLLIHLRRFWLPKWSHVGTKMASKIDANLRTPQSPKIL